MAKNNWINAVDKWMDYAPVNKWAKALDGFIMEKVEYLTWKIEYLKKKWIYRNIPRALRFLESENRLEKVLRELRKIQRTGEPPAQSYIDELIAKGKKERQFQDEEFQRLDRRDEKRQLHDFIRNPSSPQHRRMSLRIAIYHAGLMRELNGAVHKTYKVTDRQKQKLQYPRR